MNRIVPHLWFDTQAKEAAEFYASVFADSSVTNVSQLKNTPSGDCDVVSFTVLGEPFMAISAGPHFKINPSISFFVNFDPSQDPKATERIDEIWNTLIDGGKILMPLQAYPFSKRYGWVSDKYGVSWQLILTDPEGDERPLVIPSLLFVNERCGKAEEALKFYADVFQGAPMDGNDTKLGTLAQYGPGQEPNKEGTLMFGEAKLLDTWLTAMDGGGEHEFDFNEAVSLMVRCDTQEQIDYFWGKLSAVPEAEQCGWLKDKYGVSWQVTSSRLDEMLAGSDQAAIDRVTQAFLPMKKFDVATLEAAYRGE